VALLDNRFEVRDAIIDSITRSSFGRVLAHVRAAGRSQLIPDRRRRRES
jgi:hypothetical protein